MTLAAPAIADAPAPKKRGPNTPEGKARSSMNALKHGLRARSFGILPEESQAEWAEHVRDLRQGYGPVDAAEEKLVTAIAVAMWNEIRADRTLVETMAEIPPRRAGRSHGTDMQEPEHARSLGTAIRYLTAAGMATQRAQRAFLAPPEGQAVRADPARGRARRGAGQPEWHERIHARTRPPRHLACCGRPIRQIARTISRGPWSGLCPSACWSCAPGSPPRSVAPWPKQAGCRPRQRRCPARMTHAAAPGRRHVGRRTQRSRPTRPSPASDAAPSRVVGTRASKRNGPRVSPEDRSARAERLSP